MFYKFLFLTLFSSLSYTFANPNLALQCLKESYPILFIEQNRMTYKDILWELTKIPKHNNMQDYENALRTGNLADSFAYAYPLGFRTLEPFKDSTRIHDYAFLASLYGENQKNVESHLKPLTWMDGSQLLFNSQNGAYAALKRVKDRLIQVAKENPKLLTYLENIGGTYKWRKIANTNRLSAHSFGIAIDINVAKSRYWLWDIKQKALNQDIAQIPAIIVQIFEEEGFIWGGRWWHYDTMHFEYRPEILCYAKALKNAESKTLKNSKSL
ncbi:M15 family metallopeptidase [Helicobacter turcicus]|uniref:M15 family metallopeptidase n=1 Tax=Helicobacter turcicus TaxID=2867412 RepID=A0ABS7JLI6_9HELI|nr:M15 family metallopeptidase [Helicobacter turcicus]MBX7490263.1 M15 family metallopeptidase [Helicobacter turcicus]MBX7545158.1 M15 family metallopeptidase [Helicobacter turcicus]